MIISLVTTARQIEDIETFLPKNSCDKGLYKELGSLLRQGKVIEAHKQMKKMDTAVRDRLDEMTDWGICFLASLARRGELN